MFRKQPLLLRELADFIRSTSARRRWYSLEKCWEVSRVWKVESLDWRRRVFIFVEAQRLRVARKQRKGRSLYIGELSAMISAFTLHECFFYYYIILCVVGLRKMKNWLWFHLLKKNVCGNRWVMTTRGSFLTLWRFFFFLFRARFFFWGVWPIPLVEERVLRGVGNEEKIKVLQSLSCHTYVFGGNLFFGGGTDVLLHSVPRCLVFSLRAFILACLGLTEGAVCLARFEESVLVVFLFLCASKSVQCSVCSPPTFHAFFLSMSLACSGEACHSSAFVRLRFYLLLLGSPSRLRSKVWAAHADVQARTTHAHQFYFRQLLSSIFYSCTTVRASLFSKRRKWNCPFYRKKVLASNTTIGQQTLATGSGGDI